MGKIENEIDNILSNFDNKKLDNFGKEALRNSMVEFVNNGKSRKERNNILEIIKRISWFYQHDINKWFIKKITELYQMNCEYTFVYDSKEQANHGSSMENIIRSLCNCGYINEDEITKLDNLSDNNDTKYVIVDDFVGSGNTIKKIIGNMLKKGIHEKNIMIFAYVIMSDAIKMLKKDYSQVSIKYRYVEENFTEKFDEDITNYIKSVCNKNTKKNMRFGYKRVGSSISINQQSPNNNISLIWQDSIPYWKPILNRDFNLIRLKKAKEKFYIDQVKIKKLFFKNRHKYGNITLDDFKFLFLVNSGLSIDEKFIRESKIFNTDKKVDDIIFRLKRNKIIDNHLGLYYIINETLLNDIIELSKDNISYKKKQNKLL